jgi:hypothetical protein
MYGHRGGPQQPGAGSRQVVSPGTNRHLAEEFFSQAIRGQQVHNSRQDLQYHNQLHVSMPTFVIAPDGSYVEFVLEVRDELTEKVWKRHHQWTGTVAYQHTLHL